MYNPIGLNNGTSVAEKNLIPATISHNTDQLEMCSQIIDQFRDQSVNTKAMLVKKFVSFSWVFVLLSFHFLLCQVGKGEYGRVGIRTSEGIMLLTKGVKHQHWTLCESSLWILKMVPLPPPPQKKKNIKLTENNELRPQTTSLSFLVGAHPVPSIECSRSKLQVNHKSFWLAFTILKHSYRQFSHCHIWIPR